MKIYISGPMTGYEYLNRVRFEAAAELLMLSGNEVIIPHGIDPLPGKTDEDMTYDEWLRVDISRMVLCDKVFMLAGWSESKGAMIEHNLAILLNMNVEYEE